LLRLGFRIRTARIALGYSRQSFAALCGLRCAHVGGVERGERNVSFFGSLHALRGPGLRRRGAHPRYPHAFPPRRTGDALPEV